MNAILESQIAAALGRNRAPSNGSGNRSGIAPAANRSEAQSTWATDYGAGRPAIKAAAVEFARLSHGSGGDSHGDSGHGGKNRMDHGGGWSAKTLWSEVSRHLCNGTKFFAVCAGIVAFIVVI